MKITPQTLFVVTLVHVPEDPYYNCPSFRVAGVFSNLRNAERVASEYRKLSFWNVKIEQVEYNKEVQIETPVDEDG